MTHINDLRVGDYSRESSDRFSVRAANSQRRQRDDKMSKFSGLDRTVESTVVPRLVATLKAKADFATVPGGVNKESGSQRVHSFAELALHHDVREVCSAIEDLRSKGSALEDIYLTLLAPTAQRLCSLWKTDDCGFADATLALWRLQQVLREYSVAFRSEFLHREHGLRVLLVPAPGEQHDLAYAMFGLVFVSEFFLREGWDAWIEPDASSTDFKGTIRSQWFDVAEFLVCGDKTPSALGSCASTIRRESPNRSVGIMVCGQPFINNPELIRLVDTDVTKAEAQQVSVAARRYA